MGLPRKQYLKTLAGAGLSAAEYGEASPTAPSSVRNRTKFGKNAVFVGVDIGGTKTAIVLCSELPVILSRVEFPTLPNKGPDRALDLIKKTIHLSLDKLGLRISSLAAIGVSCGGPLDRLSGTIQSPPNLSTWVDIPIGSILEQEFGTECRIENDANAGAVAEHRFGAGRGARNMVFLTMGTGLGAGIIINNALYRGATEMAGEIGHVRLTRSGPVGYHKAGSVEGWASGGGVSAVATRAVTAVARNREHTSLSAVLQRKQSLTARDVSEAAKRGDVTAKRILRGTGAKLGEALAILVDILNPERIVIGGLAVRLGDLLLNPARETLRREALASSATACEIVPAGLGEQIGDFAALCVARGL